MSQRQQLQPTAHRLAPVLYLAALCPVLTACGDDGPGLGTYAFSFVTWILLSVAVANAAQRYERSSGGFLLFALFFSPIVAGLYLVAIGPDGKLCRQCSEKIRLDASVCRFCGAHAAGPPPPLPRGNGYQPPPNYGPMPGYQAPAWSTPTPPVPSQPFAPAPTPPAPTSTAAPATAPPVATTVVQPGAPAVVQGPALDRRRKLVVAGVLGGLVVVAGATTATIVYFNSDDAAPARRAPIKAKPAPTKPRR